MVISTLKQIEEAYLETTNEEEINRFTDYCRHITIKESLIENE